MGTVLVCACSHSRGAHLVSGKRTCGFCRCTGFQPKGEANPGEAIPQSSIHLMTVVSLLARTAVFRPLPAQQLVQAARLTQRRLYPEGSQILRPGEFEPSLHILSKGQVQVLIPGPNRTQNVIELGPGEVIGEAAAFDGTARLAAVTALTDLEIFEMNAPALAITLGVSSGSTHHVRRVMSERMQARQAVS